MSAPLSLSNVAVLAALVALLTRPVEFTDCAANACLTPATVVLPDVSRFANSSLPVPTDLNSASLNGVAAAARPGANAGAVRAEAGDETPANIPRASAPAPTNATQRPPRILIPAFLLSLHGCKSRVFKHTRLRRVRILIAFRTNGQPDLSECLFRCVTPEFPPLRRQVGTAMWSLLLVLFVSLV